MSQLTEVDSIKRSKLSGEDMWEIVFTRTSGGRTLTFELKYLREVSDATTEEFLLEDDTFKAIEEKHVKGSFYEAQGDPVAGTGSDERVFMMKRYGSADDPQNLIVQYADVVGGETTIKRVLVPIPPRPPKSSGGAY